MPRLGKNLLIDKAIAAIEASGWSVERLSGAGEHPARFRMSCDGVERLVRLYMWNLSHGGRTRSDAEYRVQVTGVEAFELEPEGSALILGWSEEFGIFAGFDVQRRLGAVGASPSIQVNAPTLVAAGKVGAAVQPKGRGEQAVAVRSDRLGRYVQHLEQAHAGDISRLLADDDGVASDPLAAELADRAQRGEPHSFGSDADGEARAAVVAALDELGGLLTPSKPDSPDTPDPGIGQIGHNHPPEGIGDEEQPVGPSVEEAIKQIRTELGEAEPDAERVGLAGSFIAWASRVVKAALHEGGKVLEKGKDLAREYAIKALWGTAGTLGVTFKEEIVTVMRGVAKAILHWFDVIG